MIFFLEIDGKLKKCMVHEPYASQMISWNEFHNQNKLTPEGYYGVRDALKDLARKCVEAGAYEVRE